MHPVAAPYASGRLAVGDGHEIHWEATGNPAGKPALVLHGGPGSGSSPSTRRYFDPAAFNLIQFDQRGCGRSTPRAEAADHVFATNTTAHLLQDIEVLRRHLNVERWLLFGGSWGATLALAYAQRHPDRVSAMVLRAVTNTTREEIAWVTRGVRLLLPGAWARFSAGASDAADLVAAYNDLLMSPDPAVRTRAARDWCDWEQTIVAVRADHRPDPRWQDEAFRLRFARLVTHYWRHAAWLEEGELLRHAGRLAGVPGVMVHGRLDIASPLIVPWRLAQAWPGSELVVVEAAGHDSGDGGMAAATAAAVARFR